jgi:hypothetical protein
MGYLPLPFFLASAKALAAISFSFFVDFGFANTLPASLATFLPVVIFFSLRSGCPGFPAEESALGSLRKVSLGADIQRRDTPKRGKRQLSDPAVWF